MAHDVFISHSSKDKKVADAVCSALESVKIRCWVAPRDILAGEIWQEAISRAIEKSHIMVLIFSSNSNSSKDVSKELVLAMNVGVAVIPLKIENVEPSGVMKYYLSDTHWIDSLNPPTKDQIDNIVETVSLLVYKEKINSGEKKINTVAEKSTPPEQEKQVLTKKTKFFKSNKLAIILGCALLAAIIVIVFVVIEFNNKINETKVAASGISAIESAKETMAAETQIKEPLQSEEITKVNTGETENSKEANKNDNGISSIVGSCDTPGNAYEVYIKGDYAYIADGKEGLQIVDITDKKNPYILGNCKNLGEISRIYIEGDYAYTNGKGSQVIDITDKKNPIKVGSMNAGGFSVYVSDNYAYLSNGTEGYSIVDITDKKNPQLIGNYSFFEYIIRSIDNPVEIVWDIFAEGNFLYIAVGSSDKVSQVSGSGLQIIDITDKNNPVNLGSCKTTGNACRVYADKNYAYISGDSFDIIDISNKENPSIIGTYNTGIAWDVSINGDTAYTNSYGLQIIDVKDKKNPVIIGSCKTPGNAAGIFADENYVYIADNEKGLQIIDTSIVGD